MCIEDFNRVFFFVFSEGGASVAGAGVAGASVAGAVQV